MFNLRIQKLSHTGFDYSKTNKLLLGLFILLVLVVFMPTVHSQGNTFVVNSIDDADDGTCNSQHCSLREALNASNNNAGTDTITFAIPTAGPYVIYPVDELPTITDAVMIDGTTQAGYTGKPLIVLDGVNTFAANGLVLNAGSSTVRGLVINRFQFDAVSIGTAGGNTIAGNYLGTDVTGLQARPNRYGIYVNNSNNNNIGGVNLADRNVISGNNSGGVYIVGTSNSGGSNTIQGNFVGVGGDGVTVLPNKAYGLIISSPGNTIGGTTGTIPTGPCSGACNVISSNLSSGILLAANASNTVIQGNYIGADVSGSLLRPNQQDGIEFNTGADNIQIGGVTASARNVISGNSRGEIYVRSNPSPGIITIQGNYVGLNASGSSALGNGEYGIYLGGGKTTVGGTQLGAGNVVSGHLYYGIALAYGNCESCGYYATILGNYVGTDATGTIAVPNQHGIVNIANSYPAVVGGTDSGSRNVVSGNRQDGIITSYGMSVLGNYIGVDASGYKPLGNGRFGIEVQGHEAQIGRPIAGAGNVIAYNGDDGISVRYQYDYNSIAGNSIYSNGGIGIDLHLMSAINDEGPTLNDPGDSDIGANQGQNYPTISTVSRINNQTTITGTLSSDANRAYRIEFFANSACDSSGFGEGERYLGYQTTSTDGSGNANFSVTLVNNTFVGEYVTATATYYAYGLENNNRTSEFSPCRRLLPPANFTAPSGLTTQLISQTYAVLSWQDNTSDETAFYLERSPNGLTNWTEIGSVRANATKYWVTDLACNSTSYYRVRALRGDGQYSNASNILTVTTQPCSQPTPRAFLVNSTSDSDDGICTIQNCTLREAITAANANTGNNIIVFNIAGNAPYTIRPLLPLPLISSPMTIDGTSQPGYAASPLIVVNGDLVPPAQPGTEPTRVGINIIGGGTTVSGLVINGWDYGGVGIINGGGNVIKGNYIGTDASGNTAVPNLYGVIIYESSNNVIGGATVAEHNVISGNTDDGVNIGGPNAANNKVLGNIIGLNTSGNSPLGNGDDGVKIEDAKGSIIGDTDAGSRNIIAASIHNGIIVKGANATGTRITNNYIGTDTAGLTSNGNGLYGIALEGSSGVAVSYNVISGGVGIYANATGNTIYNNIIGMNASGTSSLAGTVDGVVIDNASNNLVGAPNRSNIIAGTSHDGVKITGTSDQNLVSGNSIFGNGHLGIDLGGDGVTSNDAGDVDTGANGLQNFPTLTVAYTWQGEVLVQGNLQGVAGAIYQLEFYMNDTCNASGNGEGQTYISSQSLTVDGNGDGAFTMRVNFNVPANKFITATATSPSHNTSEFSACTPAILPSLPPNHYQETDYGFVYSGNWYSYSGTGPEGGSSKYSNDSSAKVSFPLANSVERVTIFHTQNTMYGAMDMYLISGGITTKLATIPGNGALAWAVPFNISIPAGSNRVIELRNTSSSYIGLEAVDLLGALPYLPQGTYQENNSNFIYSGNWIGFTGAGPQGGAFKYSNDVNARMIFGVDSSVGRITFYRTTYSLYGATQIYLDGALTPAATMNNNSSGLLFGVPFTIAIPSGNHTVELRNVGTNYSSVDRIDLAPSAAALPIGVYQETESNLIYNGNWLSSVTAGPLGGSRIYTNDPNANMTFNIDSSVGRVTLYRTTYAAGVYGSLQVFVDNSATPLTTIANTSAAFLYGQPFTFSVTPGNHIITLKNVGSTYSDIDQITLLAPPAALAVGTYEETESNLVYSGAWLSSVSAGPLGGSRIYTNDPSASMTFTIDNTVGRVTLYRTTYVAGVYGSLQVYLDGSATPFMTIPNTSAAFLYGQPFTFAVVPGSHSITLKNVGSTYSDIDRITLQAAAPLPAGIYQENDANLIYNGTWTANSNASSLGGARKYTSDPNGNVSFVIDNTVGRVTIYRSAYVTGVYGSMQVYLDNNPTPFTTINNVSSTLLFQQPFTFSVTPGNHVITLKNVGSTYSDIDQITLLPPSAALAVGTYEETESNLIYNGTWLSSVSAGPLGGSRIYTSDPNASMTFNIDSSVGRVTLYRTTYVAGVYGSLQVYLDGSATPFMTIPNTSAAFLYGQPFTFAVLPGSHTLTLKNVGSTYSDIDRITLQAAAPLPAGIYQETDANLIYNGTWTANSNASSLGGARKYTNDPNGNVSFAIDNTVGRVTIYRSTYVAGVYGSMQVYLDNNPTPLTTINNVSSTLLFQQPFTFSVTPGNHIITLKNVGSTYSDIDQITLLPPPAALAVGTYEETDSNLIYNGTWLSSVSAGPLGGSRIYTSDPAASMTFSIDSSVGRVTLYRTTYVAGVYGSLQVYLDGSATPFMTIPNTSAAFLYGQPFTFAVIPGSHTLTLKNVGSTYSDIDRITLQAAASLPVGVYQESDANLIYNGTWTANSNASSLGGARKYSNDPNANISFSINNTVGQVTIYRSTYVAGVYGSMQVYLDNNPTPLTTINNVSSTLLFQQPFTFSVTPGNHVITLKNVGSTYSDIDQIDLLAPNSQAQPINPTAAPSPTAVTLTPTVTPTETTLTATPTINISPTPEVTSEPTQTTTPAVTETMVSTNTPVPTDVPPPTEMPTNTPIPTDVPTMTPLPTELPSSTPIPTDIPTITAQPTDIQITG